jgi:hypothetical protein
VNPENPSCPPQISGENTVHTPKTSSLSHTHTLDCCETISASRQELDTLQTVVAKAGPVLLEHGKFVRITMIGKALPMLWSSRTDIPRAFFHRGSENTDVQTDEEHCVQVRLTTPTPGFPSLPTQSVRSRAFYDTSTVILVPS